MMHSNSKQSPRLRTGSELRYNRARGEWHVARRKIIILRATRHLLPANI